MTVRHNAGSRRYELDTEHGVALAVYVEDGDGRVFTHTEVPSADEGKGYASRLIAEALADTKRSGLRIVPACSFVAAYVRRHPEYAD